MYKVLYLPLGEELQISISDTNEIIPCDLNPWEGQFGLKMPGSLLGEVYPANYKLAKFETELSARAWVIALIERPSCRQYNMLLEYFEIVEI